MNRSTEDLRLLATKCYEMGDVYKEMADILDKENPTQEDTDRTTFLLGKVISLAIEVQQLGGK